MATHPHNIPNDVQMDFATYAESMAKFKQELEIVAKTAKGWLEQCEESTEHRALLEGLQLELPRDTSYAEGFVI